MRHDRELHAHNTQSPIAVEMLTSVVRRTWRRQFVSSDRWELGHTCAKGGVAVLAQSSRTPSLPPRNKTEKLTQGGDCEKEAALHN